MEGFRPETSEGGLGKVGFISCIMGY
jgi:hypothetical protein